MQGRTQPTLALPDVLRTISQVAVKAAVASAR
jgi:hypothetical protein